MFKYLAKTPPIFLVVLITGLYSNSAQAQADKETLNQIEQYTQEGRENSIEQITNVNQLRDVSPTDWSYEALRGLTQRYGCISGLPDGSFQGDRPITRNEFAAGLNSCFQQIERSINFSQDTSVNSLEFLRYKNYNPEAELPTMGGRLNKLESRTIQLEENQFSPTTKLTGETIFNFSDTFEGF